MDVGHDIVPQPPLVTGGGLEVDIVEMFFQLGDLRGCYRQSQFGLSFRQGHPQPPPGAELPLRTPQLAHGSRGIAGDQGIFVLVLIG